MKTELRSQVMVEVRAPSSLEEGYTFDAVYNGEIFEVVVPQGGVEAGQIFRVPFFPEAIAVQVDHSIEETTPILQPLSPPRHMAQPQAPLGTWKTSWYGCLSEGCCHPSLCNAICFPQILMGQVLTRMKLNWCGVMEDGNSYHNTTRIWIVLTVFFIYQKIKFQECWNGTNTTWFSSFQAIASDDDSLDDDDNHNNNDDNNYICDTLQTIQWIWFLATTIVLVRLRRAVRRTHGIEESFPYEDCCCAMLCGCCTVSQLARQTANYREQRAYCCTDTGMAEGWFGHRQEELERRHLQGHHLVHAHPSFDQDDRV